MQNHQTDCEPARRKRAFTLIELMIVIAIISVLAAILIPNFLHARSQSITSSCEENEKMLATAEEEYSVDNGGLYVAFTSLTTPYVTLVPSDPVKKGNGYTINTAFASYGSYQISDAGGHDSTTLINVLLEAGGGTSCSSCTSVLYDQNSGIRGK